MGACIAKQDGFNIRHCLTELYLIILFHICYIQEYVHYENYCMVGE